VPEIRGKHRLQPGQARTGPAALRSDRRRRREDDRHGPADAQRANDLADTPPHGIPVVIDEGRSAGLATVEGSERGTKATAPVLRLAVRGDGAAKPEPADKPAPAAAAATKGATDAPSHAPDADSAAAKPDAGAGPREPADEAEPGDREGDAGPREPASEAAPRERAIDAGIAGSDVSAKPPVADRLEPATYVGAAFVILANVLILTDIRVPLAGPVIGFWFLVGCPIYLLFSTDMWRGSPAAERLGYSLGAVLLLLMLGGLAINTILPPLGIARPLDPVPIVIMGDVLSAALYAFRRRRPAPFPWRANLRAVRPKATRLLLVAGLCPVLAVLGANRLNNNAGDQLSVAALVCIVVALVVMLGWRRHFSDGVISLALYPISLALLLMTSLRGWSVTGHDIQSEYRLFQLTAARGHWDVSAFHTAYSACLSITILPTEISRVVNVDDPYVYKVFFQLLFALCPVFAYNVARRYAPAFIALLAIIYFIGFPTFCNDMPFINRQEIAFLFVCIAALAITNSRWPQGWRRAAFLVAALGVELSHYSTMYLLLGMVAVAWFAGTVIRLWSRFGRRARSAAAKRPWASPRRTLGLGSVLAVGAMVAVWGGLATQTAGPLLTDLVSAITQLGRANSATNYGIFSRTSLSGQQVLDKYRTAALKQNAHTPGSLYLPYNTVAKYPTPLDNEPALPLTGLGRAIERIGIPVTTLNDDVRGSAAKDEQLFIAAGFAAFLFSRRFRNRVSHEVIYLCAGSIVMVGVFTVFPALSIDYGVLRAFQEALILAAPLLVIGSVGLFSPFGDQWSLRISGAVCLGFFISTVGLMPQLLGGYPAQLGLNNSGQYYDVYYVHPQDVAAVSWLAGKPGVLPSGLQASLGPFTANMFAFNSLSTVNGGQFVNDLYPALTLRQGWVLLNYSIVHTDRAPLASQGELVTYAYPRQLLQANKNLVYNNGGAEIYR
jgi:uncharacterized membrane protein